MDAAYDNIFIVVDDSKLVSGLSGSRLGMLIEVVQFCRM